MGFNLLLILFIVSLILSSEGFYKYVYFLSVGYGLSVAGIGIALIVMGIAGIFPGMQLPHYILSALFIIYGFRLSGFLLVREIKNAAYRKTLTEVVGSGDKMPIFVKIVMWLGVSVLYTAQTSGVFFRLYNGAETGTLVWVGIIICLIAIIIESEADREKSAQKKKRPDMVAKEGLYKIVRCPNYFGEILFWTGITVSSLDILTGAGQWIMVIVAYVCIVYIMFNGAQRLEKRQMKRYADNAEYHAYADKTPIIIPLIPIYHLNKDAKKN